MYPTVFAHERAAAPSPTKIISDILRHVLYRKAHKRRAGNATVLHMKATATLGRNALTIPAVQRISRWHATARHNSSLIRPLTRMKSCRKIQLKSLRPFFQTRFPLEGVQSGGFFPDMPGNAYGRCRLAFRQRQSACISRHSAYGYPIEKWTQRCNLLCNMPENHWRSEAAASLCQTESANGLRIGASGLTRVFLKFSRFGAVMPPRAIVRHGSTACWAARNDPFSSVFSACSGLASVNAAPRCVFAKLRCKKSVPRISF